MEPLTRRDILPAGEYERRRPAVRRRIMTVRSRRRVPVGEHCSVHFENRDTIWYQVHEMLRAEGSWDKPGAVEAELEAYNPLVPRRGELSATVMFEYETPEERAERLAQLVGIERHLWLAVADLAPVLAQFDEQQMDRHRISSVQYVKWRLDAGRRARLKEEGTVVRIVLDHPRYRAQAVLSEETRREIMNDPD